MAKRIELPYMPTQKQALFHASTADEVLYGGAAGGGKSCAIVMDAALRCFKTRGLHAYLFRRTYRELEDSLILQAHKLLPEGLGKYNATGHDWRFENGSCMHFRHCETDADRYKYQGTEIHALYIDELTHFSHEVYAFLRTRLRAEKRLGTKPVARYSANPGGIGHAWVKARFVDAVEPGTIVRERIESKELGISGDHTRLFLPARATDNPHLQQTYLLELEQKPQALRDALLLGKWDAYEGQVFTEWRNERARYDERRYTHVVRGFEIPAHWPRYRAFDWGYAKPFAVLWFAVGEDGEAVLYREWYGAKGEDEGLRMPPREVAKRIAQLERDCGEKPVGIADPAIYGAAGGQSVAEQMEAEGVYFRPADNARIAGKMQLHHRLRFDDEGRPGLYVFDRCRHFIRTIPALVYDPARPEDVDTHGEDHAYDAARYFLMERPVSAKPAQKLWKPPPYDPLR